MDYKVETEKAYDKKAKSYRKFTARQQALMQESYDLFLKYLKGKRVLDIGSGTGRDSIHFKSQGLKPVAIDISSEMVKVCKQSGIEAYKMDLEKMTFPEDSFDGVWACTSLICIPKKKLSKVLKSIKRVLKPRGVLYVSVFEGKYEGFVTERDDSNWFFCQYMPSELESLLEKEFEIKEFIRQKAGDIGHVAIAYICLPRARSN